MPPSLETPTVNQQVAAYSTTSARMKMKSTLMPRDVSGGHVIAAAVRAA
jgi:hypothetical protein